MKCSPLATSYFMPDWCQNNMAEIKSRATGTTFPEISKQNFRPLPMVLPPLQIMRAFTSAVEPLYQSITASIKESRDLAMPRDTLLPKLLSGEVSAPAAMPVAVEARGEEG